MFGTVLRSEGAEEFSPGFQPGLYTQFVGGNKTSLDGVNEYRLEAYATLLFGASSDRSRSCGKSITADPPRRRDGVKDRGRESECSPSLRTGQAVFQRPALQLMGSTVRLRASRFRDRLLALSALYASCGQVEQPGLVKEASSFDPCF